MRDGGGATAASPIRLARPITAFREYAVLNFTLIALAICEKDMPRATPSRGAPECSDAQFVASIIRACFPGVARRISNFGYSETKVKLDF